MRGPSPAVVLILICLALLCVGAAIITAVSKHASIPNITAPAVEPIWQTVSSGTDPWGSAVVVQRARTPELDGWIYRSMAFGYTGHRTASICVVRDASAAEVSK